LTFKVIEFGASREPVYEFLWGLSHTITEIQRVIGQKSQILPTFSYFALSFGVTPFEFIERFYGSWN